MDIILFESDKLSSLEHKRSSIWLQVRNCGPRKAFGFSGDGWGPPLIEGADQEANRAEKSVLARYRPILDRYHVVSP